MPEDENGQHSKTGIILQHQDLLTYEEILRLAKISVDMGVRKIRLTGGEPLVRRGVMDFIGKLNEIGGLEQISITTNGILLAENASQLWDYGVRQLNISLDSLRRDKFQEITKRDNYLDVRKGITAAQKLGFKIKLNVVAMKGINSDEFADFAKLAIAKKIEVRFIEFMPIGKQSSWSKDRFISMADIKDIVSEVGDLSVITTREGAGPAKIYEIKDDEGNIGRLGFISPLSHHFCDQCNRLRLTSEGKLRSCLLNDKETDIKEVLRAGGTDEDLGAVVQEVVLAKPKGHLLDSNGPGLGDENCSGQMSRIGG